MGRSKYGCRTCKIRRVKCGEERPQCVRCSSTGRQCDYAFTAISYPLGSLQRYRPSNSSPVQRERDAFEYYFYNASRSMSDPLDLPFWRDTVLQIARSEPAVWDAIASLSTLYRFPPLSHSSQSHDLQFPTSTVMLRSRNHQEALAWYCRSSEGIRHQINRGSMDIAVALVSCILFICIEIVQGNIQGALGLYQQGMKLAQLVHSARLTTPSSPLAMAAAVLGRMRPWARMIGDASDAPGAVSCPNSGHRSLSSTAGYFTSLSDARNELYSLVTEWLALDGQWKKIRPRWTAKSMSDKVQLEARLRVWFKAFRLIDEVIHYTARPRSNVPPLPISPHDGIIASLLMTYTSISILTQSCLNTSECVYDSYDGQFAEIVSHGPVALAATACEDGQQPPFAFDMGIGIALFITSFKCRSPSVRRKALQLQLQSPHIQGLYMGPPAARVLAAIVAIEEAEGPLGKELPLAGLLDSFGTVPAEDRRVVDFSLAQDQFSKSNGRNILQYSRWQRDDNNMVLVTEEIVISGDLLT